MKLFEIKSDDDKIIELIKKDCASFLKITDSKNPLYRGMLISNKELIYQGLVKAKVRKDRKPQAGSHAAHTVLNNYFNDTIGIKIRSEAIFASFDRDTAERYVQDEEPAVIFPIGKFRYVWSPKVADAFTDIAGEDDVTDALDYVVNHLHDELIVAIMDLGLENEFTGNLEDLKPGALSNKLAGTKLYEKILYQMLKNGLYLVDKDLKSAAKSGNEVMIVCDEYYALEEKTAKRIFKKLYEAI